MYSDPLSVKGILHQSANDAMRADSGKIDLVCETMARGLGIGLSWDTYIVWLIEFKNHRTRLTANKTEICIAPRALRLLTSLRSSVDARASLCAAVLRPYRELGKLLAVGESCGIGEHARIFSAWGGELDTGAVGEWQGDYWRAGKT